MQADVLLGGIEQLGHFALVQPHGAIHGLQLDFRLSILGAVNDQFSPVRRAHSVTPRNSPMIRFSTAASSASISASGRGGWYWKNSRLKLIS